MPTVVLFALLFCVFALDPQSLQFYFRLRENVWAFGAVWWDILALLAAGIRQAVSRTMVSFKQTLPRRQQRNRPLMFFLLLEMTPDQWISEFSENKPAVRHSFVFRLKTSPSVFVRADVLRRWSRGRLLWQYLLHCLCGSVHVCACEHIWCVNRWIRRLPFYKNSKESPLCKSHPVIMSPASNPRITTKWHVCVCECLCEAVCESAFVCVGQKEGLRYER